MAAKQKRARALAPKRAKVRVILQGWFPVIPSTTGGEQPA